MQEKIIYTAFATLVGVLTYSFAKKLFRRVTVLQFQNGLLYKKGEFKSVLKAGSYWLWQATDTITVVDVRRSMVTLSGQEIVTADNIAIKFSCLLSYRIVDANKAINDSQSWYQEIYAFTQIALRDLLSSMKLDDILQNRTNLGDKLLDSVRTKASEIGIEMHMVQVKDIILPAEIRKIYGDIVRAQKEGMAALERARAEHAALRNLANAARLLETNPALMNLRVLQAIQSQNSSTPPTIVLGVPGMMPFFSKPKHGPCEKPGHKPLAPPDLPEQGESE